MRKIAVILGCCLCTWASATNYYVATNGKDSNPGTFSQPWATWQKAFTSTSVQPGDTVFFRGGVYPATVKNGLGIQGTRSGTQNLWIVYMNYPGEDPILDCGNLVKSDIQYEGLRNYGITISKDFVKIKGLTVRNVKQYYNRNFGVGIRLMSKNIIAENCTAYNVWGHGFEIWSGSSGSGVIQVINCDSYNNCDSISGDPLGSNAGNTGAGFSCWDNGGTLQGKVYFKGCRAWGTSDQGFQTGGSYYIECDSCWSFCNQGYYYSGQSYGGGTGWKCGWLDYPSNFLIQKITRCLAAYNDHNGFMTNSVYGKDVPIIHMFNNSSIRNNIGYEIDRHHTNYDDEILRLYRNNIAFDNSIRSLNIRFDAQYTHDHNSWDGNASITSADFKALPANKEHAKIILSAPRKADGSLPDLGDYFKLKSTSKAVDAGVDVGLTYKGSAPDLGPFEYDLGSSTPPASPVYSGSVIENASPARLEMTYDMNLANVVPAVSAFSVRVNSNPRQVNSVSISGNKVILNLSAPVVNGDRITVAYTKPNTNPLQTPAGGQAEQLAAQQVTNNVRPANPVYVSSKIDDATPSRLEMTYDLNLANVVPATSAFSVRVNSNSRQVNSVSISGNKVTLNLASPVVNGDRVTVAYTKPNTNPLQTPAGGQAEQLAAQQVTNNVRPASPVYVSSKIDDATPSRLEMTYDMNLANIVPAVSAFSVRVNSNSRQVSSVSISGNKVFLTLAAPVVYDDLVTIAYTTPRTNPLQTPAGGQAETLTAQNVTNNCRIPANQPPVANISFPGKNSSFTAPATIEFEVNAFAPDGTIKKIEFFNGNQKLGELLSAPYYFAWKDVAAGNYSVYAVATDNFNRVGYSDTLTVFVVNSTTSINQLPVISISTPKQNSSVKAPSTITLTADAYDPDGDVILVEYFIGEEKIGESSEAPYKVQYECFNSGIYEITAIATDNLNAFASSSVLFSATPANYNPDIIRLYPNPNNGIFSISLLTSFLTGENDVSIMNLAGKTVYQGIINQEEQEKLFELSDLDPGIYILVIKNDKIIYTRKFIINS